MAAAALSFSSLAAAGAAPTVLKIDLSGDSAQQYAVAAGTIELELSPMVPGATYEIGGSQKLAAEAAPKADGTADADLCKNPQAWLWKKLAAASDEGEIGAIIQAAKIDESKQCGVDGRKTVLAAIDEIASGALTSSITVEHKVVPPRTLEIKRGEAVWTVYLVRGAAAGPDLLNDIEKRMEADSSSTILECSYLGNHCEDEPLYVNADHVSIVVFRGVPTDRPLTVVVDSMSEPFERCQVLRQNSISFPSTAPDVVAVTLHLFRDPYFGLRPSRYRVSAALRLYGVTSDSDTLDEAEIKALCNAPTPSLRVSSGAAVRSKRALVRSAGGSVEEVTTIPIVADGQTETVKVTFYSGDEALRSFIVPFRYQRWWADAGGAFLFPNNEDERLKTETDANGKVKVTGIDRDDSNVEPDTGIVVNLHPGNYPELGIQFGLSTGRDSELSYYLGPALRLREVGKRGLATFSFGAALSKMQNYPDLAIYDPAHPTAGGIYDASDARLLGTRSYELSWYFGVSLGFTFGGVASGADAVKELP
jgi:hypothetical protein